MHRQPSPMRPLQLATLAGLGLWTLAAAPAVVRGQATTRPALTPAVAREAPRYPHSTTVTEEMIHRRPRQVIALPSEPGEYGEDPLQLSSGVLGKLPPEVHRLPEGYVVSSQQMAVEQGADWCVCYLSDERVVKLSREEAAGWAAELDKAGIPAGLGRAVQDKGIILAPEAKVQVETPGICWRIADPRRTLVVEQEADGVVVRSALPLRVLPNKRLTMLESVIAVSDTLPKFAFTGRITEFQANNYLLVEHLAEVVDVSERANAAAPEAQPAAPDPTSKPPATAPSGEPRPEDIIKQLLERKPRRALVLPPNAPEPTLRPVTSGQETDSGRENLLPEETMIVDQPGRVVPMDKWWTFAFEDKGRQSSQRPMRLLPNRMLENAIALSGDETMGVVLLVSGEVTEYRGTNYLLLRKVLVQRDWGNIR